MPSVTCPRCAAQLDAEGTSCPVCSVTDVTPTSKPSPLDLQEFTTLQQATIGEFDIAGVVGRGGMATVYLAHDVTLNRKVAIKVMPRSVSDGEGAERFRREARTAAALSHPNIIPIYAVKERDGLLCIVMKFVAGRPLDDILAELGPLPIPMVQAILAQVAGALDYAHRQGVIHRDVKPANILIDDEGWAIVTDFGIARVAESTGLTTTGATVGTPTYMSPEQCLSDGTITGASDQYSLGILAYELLTGTTPFAGKPSLAMMYAHVHDIPQPIVELRPECPPPLASLVERMLAKAPADRWETLDDVVQELGDVPLSVDDPTRSHLIRVAKTGQQSRLHNLLRTPRSPIPMVNRSQSGRRTLPTTPAAASGSGAMWARASVAGAALLAAAFYFAPWRQAPSAADLADTALASTPAPVAQPMPDSAAPAAAVTPAPPPARRDSTSATAPAHAGRSAPATPDRATTSPQAPAPREQPSSIVILDPDAPPIEAGEAPVTGQTALLGNAARQERLTTEMREAVVQTLADLGDALAAGDLGTVQRLHGGLSASRLGELAEFFAAGGRFKVRWQVSDVALARGGVTADVTGTLTDLGEAGSGAVRTMDGRAVLERRGSGWRIRQLPL
jgi:serine/threonine-protein kinase